MATEEKATRPVPVKIFTANNVVTGHVHVPATGYRGRVSDLLNTEDFEFLPVTDANLFTHDGNGPIASEDCVIINKHIIHSVIPIGEGAEEGARPRPEGAGEVWS